MQHFGVTSPRCRWLNFGKHYAIPKIHIKFDNNRSSSFGDYLFKHEMSGKHESSHSSLARDVNMYVNMYRNV